MSGGDSYSYTAYGLRWRSAIALPLLPEPTGAAPDVAVRIGAALPVPVANGGLWDTAPGVFSLNVDGVARYQVTDGREVLIEPASGARDQQVGNLLMGPVLAALLQQRGVSTLHASAIATDSGAVLFLGQPGVGKSTLLATMVERGYAMLADDVTGVVLDASGQPLALPAFPQTQLWANVVDALGWRGRVERKARPELDKYLVPVERFHPTPLAVRAAFTIRQQQRDNIDIARARPAAAWLSLHTYRRRFLPGREQLAAHLRVMATIAKRVPVNHVTRPSWPFQLDALADEIETHLRQGGQERPAAVNRRPRAALANAPRIANDRDGRSPAPMVWLASYPKSGNTWLRALLTSYLDETTASIPINDLIGGRLGEARRQFDEYLGVPSSDLTLDEICHYLPRYQELVAERLSRPTFVKTHGAYCRGADQPPLFSARAAAGAVYLIRNPLDVVVSYAHHMSRSIDATLDWMHNHTAIHGVHGADIATMLPQFMGSWSRHVTSWLEQKRIPLHVTRYEDLLADAPAAFGAIIRFAGLSHDDARLARAIRYADFDRLRAQEQQSGFDERPSRMRRFFRAGIAGAWRNTLNPTQVLKHSGRPWTDHGALRISAGRRGISGRRQGGAGLIRPARQASSATSREMAHGGGRASSRHPSQRAPQRHRPNLKRTSPSRTNQASGFEQALRRRSMNIMF